MTDNEMDRRQDSWHLSKSIPISIIIGFVLQSISIVWWASKVDSDVKNNTKVMLKHHENEAEHMPFHEKIRVFVPRSELDARLTSIEQGQDDMKHAQEETAKDVKELLRAIK